jgi:potassium efflux system protein
VVPNKKLVTENLMNWTLTDSNYRMDLVMGIAYGSDTEKVREILLKIAANHPKVLEQPRPKAIFRAFGSSSLEIEFRIFIPHMDFWPRVITEVNTAIARSFAQAGIEFAFPQHDVHIRSINGALPQPYAMSIPSDGRVLETIDAK